MDPCHRTAKEQWPSHVVLARGKLRIMKPPWKPDCGQNILLCFILHVTKRPGECPSQHSQHHGLRSALLALATQVVPFLPTWATRSLTAILAFPPHLRGEGLWASATHRGLNREKNEGSQCPWKPGRNTGFRNDLKRFSVFLSDNVETRELLLELPGNTQQAHGQG